MGGKYDLLSLWLRHFRQGPVEWLWRQLTLRASGTSLKTHPDNDLDHNH
ncbi:hypothetical protein DMH27_10305 [Raoultella planticola]|nr:hypothetical protein [Raoultella planticola]